MTTCPTRWIGIHYLLHRRITLEQLWLLVYCTGISGEKASPACRNTPFPQAHNRLSIDGETVEQPITTGATQGLLAAATARAAREMRRIPGFGGIVVAQALAVMVAEHRRALAAACPVAARRIVAARKRPAVRLRAGQDIVHIRSEERRVGKECRS